MYLACLSVAFRLCCFTFVLASGVLELCFCVFADSPLNVTWCLCGLRCGFGVFGICFLVGFVVFGWFCGH